MAIIMTIILVKDKWDTYAIDASDLDKAALSLLDRRYDEGYWYSDWDDGDPANQWATRAGEILEAKDGKAAWNFLKERSDEGFEYEWLDLMDVKDPT